eukprot:tig00020903_g15083.t1
MADDAGGADDGGSSMFNNFSFDNLQIAGIVVSLVMSIASGIWTTYTANKQAILQQKIDEQKAEKEDWYKRKELMQNYKGPLAAATYELQSRLNQIAGPNHMLAKFCAKKVPGQQESHDEFYAITHTLYLIAAFFGWIEIIRREICFLEDLGEYNKENELEKGVVNFIDSMINMARHKVLGKLNKAEQEEKEKERIHDEIKAIREIQEDIAGCFSIDPKENYSRFVAGFKKAKTDEMLSDALRFIEFDEAYAEHFAKEVMDPKYMPNRELLQLYKGEQMALAELVIKPNGDQAAGGSGDRASTMLGKFTLLNYTEFAEKLRSVDVYYRWFNKPESHLKAIANIPTVGDTSNAYATKFNAALRAPRLVMIQCQLVRLLNLLDPLETKETPKSPVTESLPQPPQLRSGRFFTVPFLRAPLLYLNANEAKSRPINFGYESPSHVVPSPGAAFIPNKMPMGSGPYSYVPLGQKF